MILKFRDIIKISDTGKATLFNFNIDDRVIDANFIIPVDKRKFKIASMKSQDLIDQKLTFQLWLPNSVFEIGKDKTIIIEKSFINSMNNKLIKVLCNEIGEMIEIKFIYIKKYWVVF